VPRHGRQYILEGPPYTVNIQHLGGVSDSGIRDAIPDDVISELLERVSPQPGTHHTEK
jgi:hypothetical protein